MQLNCYTRGTRKLVLHHVNCLLLLSLFLSPSFPSIHLSSRLSRFREILSVSDGRTGLKGALYFAFIVVLEVSRHFSRVYCVGLCEFTTNRWLLGRVVWASLQPRLPFDEFPRRQCLPEPVVNRFYELIAAVYQLRCYSFTLNRRLFSFGWTNRSCPSFFVIISLLNR